MPIWKILYIAYIIGNILMLLWFCLQYRRKS